MDEKLQAEQLKFVETHVKADEVQRNLDGEIISVTYIAPDDPPGIPDDVTEFDGQIVSWTYISPFWKACLELLEDGWLANEMRRQQHSCEN